MNLRNIFFILLLSSFIACGNSINKGKPGKTGFAVTGVIKNAKGSINIQEITNTGLLPLDTSVILEDGTFELTGTVKEKTFCVIRLDRKSVV